LVLVTAGCFVGILVSVVAGSGIAEASSTPTAYVTNSGSDSVTPIITATNATGTALPGFSGPWAVAITPDGTRAYVVNYESNSVTPVELATDTKDPAIPVGNLPRGIAITPNGSTAYTTNSNDGTVTPINTATEVAGTPISVGSGPEGIAITPDGTTAYVANAGSNTVTPIDVASNTTETPIPVGSSPFGIAITPDGRTAYVADAGSNSVTPINIATNSAETPITVGSGPEYVAITPDGSTAYVTNQNSDNVTPIQTATDTTGPAINLPSDPAGIAITPDGSTAYVPNAGSDNVSPIDTTSNTPGSTIGVGSSPTDIAITPDQAPEAELSVTPAASGSPTSFDASASVAPSSPITSYAWNFGDGNTLTTSAPTATHTYTSSGTFTATVTETDEAGTSTTQVFTGQTMSNNGGPQAEASQSFVVVPCSAGMACSGTVSNASQDVTVGGTSSTNATLEVSLGLQSVTCNSSGAESQQVTTYSTENFTASSLTSTLKLDDFTDTAGFDVCYSSTTAFTDKQGNSVTTGELAKCSSNGNVAPCLSSVTTSGGNLTATLLVLPGDPRFWSPTVIANFSPASGAIGTRVTIKGGPWNGVESVSFDGVQTQFKLNAKATKLTAVVPAGAKKGVITVVTPDGVATSTTKFKVTK
jgi:YVTN family beta-propeller protein